MQLPNMMKDEQVKNTPQQTTVTFDDTNITISSAFCSGNLSKVAKSASGGPFCVSIYTCFDLI